MIRGAEKTRVFSAFNIEAILPITPIFKAG